MDSHNEIANNNAQNTCAGTPKVSVIVPVYNVEKYLRECMDSLCNQTLKDIEIICVDDCSKDHSFEILKEYERKDSRVIAIRHEKNSSCLCARKNGLEIAKGKYVTFIDGDDSFTLDACEVLFNAIENSPCDFIICGTTILNCVGVPEARIQMNQRILTPPDEEIRGDMINEGWRKKTFPRNVCSKIYRRELLEKAYAEIPAVPLFKANDCCLMLAIAYYAKSCSGIPNRLYKYKFGVGSVGGNVLSFEKFKTLLTEKKSWEIMCNFMKNKPDRENYQDVLDDIYASFRSECFNKWLNLVSLEDSPEAFKHLIETWGAENIVPMLAEKFWSAPEKILPKIKSNTKSFLSPNPRTPKTIAFCYRCIDNGGAQRVTADLCNIFAQIKDGNGSWKYNVVLITDDAAKTDDYALNSRVRRRYLPAHDKHSFKDYRLRADGWKAILDEEKIDLITTGLWTAPCTFWDILSTKLHPSHPAFIIHSHSFCAVPHINTNYKRVCCGYQICDGVVALGNCDKHYIGHFCGNVKTILNPLPIEIPDKNSNFEPNTVVWVGRISAEKRPIHAIKMMNEVVKRIPDAKLYLVGGNGNAKIFDEMKSEIKKSHLEKNVILTGFSPNPSEFYQKASVFVSTSEFEGFPVTFIEAKTFALPIVSYELPWLTFTREGSGMISVPQENYEALAEKLIYLLENPKKAKKIGIEGKNALIKMYKHKIESDWEKLFANCFDKNAFPQEIENKKDAAEFSTIIRKFIIKWSGDPAEAILFLNQSGFNLAPAQEVPTQKVLKKLDLIGESSQDSKLSRLVIRIAAFFIFNKQARKRFRERHMDLNPKDGVDVNILSPEELRSRQREKRRNRWYLKLFNALVPATRAKIQHSERHILEAIAKQNAQLRKEIQELRKEQKALKDKIEKNKK